MSGAALNGRSCIHFSCRRRSRVGTGGSGRRQPLTKIDVDEGGPVRCMCVCVRIYSEDKFSGNLAELGSG